MPFTESGALGLVLTLEQVSKFSISVFPVSVHFTQTGALDRIFWSSPNTALSSCSWHPPGEIFPDARQDFHSLM